MMASASVTLPWPPRDLSPNARVHWSRKSRAAKKFRAACFYLAKLDRLAVDWEGDIIVSVTFRPPAGSNGRRHDQDNCVASCKSGLDGLADALKVNDKRFRLVPAMGEPVKGGQVYVSIGKGD